MRVAFALGGTDLGQSGIGRYVREVLPRMGAELAQHGDELIAFGTEQELRAYAGVFPKGLQTVALPRLLSSAGVSAAFHLLGVDRLATRHGADVLFLPAANRRISLGLGRASVATVAVVHDLAQLKVKQKYDQARMIYFHQALLPAMARMDQLVAVSGATRDDLCEALHLEKPRVLVIPNGVNTERFAPIPDGDPRIAQSLTNLGVASPYILYPSRLEHPGKNHVRLIHAFAKCEASKTHSLVLAGQDWGGKSAIEEAIQSHGLAQRVQLLGYVADSDLPGLIAGAELVLMMGLHEGFGLPALEALAMGKRVCASSTGALPEVVGELGALCDPLDERDIARVIDATLANNALKERCKAEGPTWGRAHGWDASVRKLVEACRTVAKRRTEGRAQ